MPAFFFSSAVHMYDVGPCITQERQGPALGLAMLQKLCCISSVLAGSYELLGLEQRAGSSTQVQATPWSAPPGGDLNKETN